MVLAVCLGTGLVLVPTGEGDLRGVHPWISRWWERYPISKGENSAAGERPGAMGLTPAPPSAHYVALGNFPDVSTPIS